MQKEKLVQTEQLEVPSKVKVMCTGVIYDFKRWVAGIMAESRDKNVIVLSPQALPSV